MTKEFDERHAAKSRAVCAAMADGADTEKRVLSERERMILDAWPRFEDGECVWFGDAVASLGCAITVEAIEFTRDMVCVKDAEDGGWSTSIRALYPLKRPAPADSWERLEEDAVKSMCMYWRCGIVECEKCPVTVDGKSPRERLGVQDCDCAKTVDLVRRAKALAGVK